MSRLRFYLASPFFQPYQVEALGKLEDKLTELKLDFYSPRLDGVILKDMSPAEREAAAKHVYDTNVINCNPLTSACMLACTDDFDSGTSYEMGFYNGVITASNGKLPNLLLSFSSKGYGANVMLSQAGRGHFQLNELLEFLVKFTTVYPDTTKRTLYDYSDFIVSQNLNKQKTDI